MISLSDQTKNDNNHTMIFKKKKKINENVNLQECISKILPFINIQQFLCATFKYIQNMFRKNASLKSWYFSHFQVHPRLLKPAQPLF